MRCARSERCLALRSGGRHAPAGPAIGADSHMLQPLALAVIGGIVVSMILSLIITPAVHYYLTRHAV
jgi:multidrug efflux pump subunit AcrB